MPFHPRSPDRPCFATGSAGGGCSGSAQRVVPLLATPHRVVVGLVALGPHELQTGERLRYEGEFYQHTLLTPVFDPGPIDHPRIPVSVAG